MVYIKECPDCPKSCPEMKKSSRKEEYRNSFPIWGKIWDNLDNWFLVLLYDIVLCMCVY